MKPQNLKTKNRRLQNSSYFTVIKLINPDFSISSEKIEYSQIIGKKRNYSICQNETLFAEQFTLFAGIRDHIGYPSFYSDDPNVNKKIEYGHTLANTAFSHFVLFVDKAPIAITAVTAVTAAYLNRALLKLCRKKHAELGLYTTDYLVALAFINEIKSCMYHFGNGQVIVKQQTINSDMTHLSIQINFSIKNGSALAEIYVTSDNDDTGYMSL